MSRKRPRSRRREGPTLSQRLRANASYLRRPCAEFLPLMIAMALLVFIGGFCFQALYVGDDGKRLSYLHGVYVTYCLIFMEHLLEWPKHWLLQVFYVVLPPLGLAVILDGIVRFSYHILRRDETSPEWTRAMAHTMQDHVILFGLGKLGLRILQELLRLEEQVVVVERDSNCPNLAYARKHGVPVRIGMGREEDILLDLNIKSAKSVILATNDDLMNLEIAIDAREIRPGIRVVLRVFDQELADKVKNTLDLKLAFSTWELSAPVFAMASADRTILNAFYVGKDLMVVAKIRIAPDSMLAGKQVADLRTEHRALVLAVDRGNDHRLIPDSEFALRAEDIVTLQCLCAELGSIHDENGDRLLFDEPMPPPPLADAPTN